MRALILTTILSVLANFCVGSAALANPQVSASDDGNIGKLTEVKGVVYTRGFRDSNREIWGDPINAKVGDTVCDGMQVGTGQKSWSQVNWKHVTARAWENSVYMVAPSQKLVYLVGGEILFNLDKHRKDKTPYSIWTKYLHASVRGTTLLVQTEPGLSRVTVLEGTIDVTNRLDNSVVTLTPGVVYEVKAKESSEEKKVENISMNSTDTPLLSSNTTAFECLALDSTKSAFMGKVDLNQTQLLNLSNVNLNPLVLFDSLTSLSLATLLNVDQILLHPLLSSFDSTLQSLPLIKEELPVIHELSTDGILKCLELRQVPILTSYNLGSPLLPKITAADIKHWAPTGVLNIGKQGLPLNLANNGLGNTLTGTPNGLIQNVVSTPLTTVSQLGGALSSTVGRVTSVVPGVLSGLGGVARGGGGGLPISLPTGGGGAPGGGGGGVLGGVGGAVGAVGGALGGLGGGLGGLFH